MKYKVIFMDSFFNLRLIKQLIITINQGMFVAKHSPSYNTLQNVIFTAQKKVNIRIIIKGIYKSIT